MRQSEERPLDPRALAELEAIDATLRGEPVDPSHAELAELALFVAAERPQLPSDAAERLDTAAARRFAPAAAGPQAGGPAVASAGDGSGRRRDRDRGAWAKRASAWTRRPALGIGLAGVLAIGVVGALALRGGVSSSSMSSSSASASKALAPPAYRLASPGVSHAAATRSLASGSGSGSGSGSASGSGSGSGGSGSGGSGSSASGGAADSPSRSVKAASGAARTFGPQGTANGTTSSSAPAIVQPSTETVTPAPPSNGRKAIQSAQLQLLTSGDHIDAVSQELFDVVGLQDGIVKSSTITQAGAQDGYASFQLSIPSANLATTMTQLSQLRYATVASRTDQTQDVNDQYQSDLRAEADAKALRTSLLKQLQNAVTQTQINSLQAQLGDNEATIESDERALSSLSNTINYSSLQVQINAGEVVPVTHADAGTGGGFTLHRAWHDAVRVLTVTAGVALIALAVLLPIALLLALGLWVASAVRRHRRESALDAA